MPWNHNSSSSFPMSYSMSGYMHCEPFVYWGDLPVDWVNFVKRVDVGEFVRARDMKGALAYLDRVEFVPNPHCEVTGRELEAQWFLSRRGEVTFCSPEDWWEKSVLFPLDRNSFPFVFLTEEDVEGLIEEIGEDLREIALDDVPGPFEHAGQLEDYVKENLDVWEETEKLEVWDLKLRNPHSIFEKELEIKNFDGDGHLGRDILLEFLARAGVINRDFHDWSVSFHLTGEDGREFSICNKIVGNEVDSQERW